MRKELQTRQVVASYTTRHKRKLMNAQLGNNAGVVETGTADFWWIRLHGDDNQVVRARSSRDVVPNAGIDVVVELVQREGLPYYQILGRALGILYPTEPYANRVIGHHEQHEQGDAGAGGFDPVSVFPRMVAPLRAHEETVPAMTVYVDAGDAAIGSTHLRFLGGSSPAFSNPTTFNRFDLLYLGTDNALHVLAGTEASGWVTPTRPTMTTTGVPIAWVLLTASMTTILEGDIYDAGILRSGVGLSTINDESVLHDKVGSPALFTLHDDWITRGSSGVIDGTLTYVTVGSTAVKISVIAGDGYVRLTNDQQGELVFCHWNASADIYTFSAPAAGQENVIFIGVEYSAGNVTAVTKTAFTDWNWFTNFPLARASYDGTTMRIANLYAHAEDTANFARKVLRLTHPFEREEAPEGTGGLEISDVATRQIAMTAGRIWHGFNNLILNAIAAGTTFYTYYRRAGGGFNLGTATQWENTLYDDASGTLQTMTNNRYGTRWIYLDVSGNTVGSAYNGSLAMVYGTSNATSVANAQAETAPSIPAHLQYHGRLIGRIIFQKSAAAATLVESAWTNAFAASAVGNHALLSNLDYASAAHTGFAASVHDILTAHSYAGGNALDVVGLSAGSTLAILTPSSNPVNAKILCSNSSGGIFLVNVWGKTRAGSTNSAALGAQIALYHNNATGLFTLDLVPSNLTADHTITFPNLDGAVALGAGSATVSSTNNVGVASHTHAVTSSSNPGAAAAILATDANGDVTLHSWSLIAAAGTRSSDTVFTITGDVTAYLFKGTKLKLTDTTTKYFYVLSATYGAPNTTVTVTGGSDYVVAGNPSAIYCSNLQVASGFPNVFNWTPTRTGYSADPTDTVNRFWIIGNVCYITIRDATAGTSNATTTTYTLPVPAVTLTNASWQCPIRAVDNGAVLGAPALARILSAGTLIDFFKDYSGGAWTNSGGKGITSAELFYEI